VDLYIVRHAIAEDRDPQAWPDDSERPLTDEGRKRFRKAARGLRSLVPTVDLVLSSPFTRAWQTAELLQKYAHWPAPTSCEEFASGRAPEDAVCALQEGTSAERVAVVGHEPHLHYLASLLLTGDPERVKLQLRKGAAAYVTFAGRVQPGEATLQWLLQPRVLRALD